jgi:hypothetical protein
MIDPNNKAQWKAAFSKFAVRWVKDKRGQFAFEDIRRAWLAKNYPPPAHPNSWGSIWVAIKKAIKSGGGEVVVVDHTKAKVPTSHGRDMPVWEYREAA